MRSALLFSIQFRKNVEVFVFCFCCGRYGGGTGGVEEEAEKEGAAAAAAINRADALARVGAMRRSRIIGERLCIRSHSQPRSSECATVPQFSPSGDVGGWSPGFQRCGPRGGFL